LAAMKRCRSGSAENTGGLEVCRRRCERGTRGGQKKSPAARGSVQRGKVVTVAMTEYHL
jgi:hypothetical protein